MARFALPPRGLHTLFPASGASPHAPDNLLDEVSLVTVWPGKALSFEKVESAVFVSTPALAPSLDAVTAGANEWVEILYGDVSHDSASARIIQLAMRRTAQNFFLARWTNMTTGLLSGQPGGFEPLFASGVSMAGGSLGVDRILARTPLYLPPTTTLRAFGDAAGLNWSIFLALVFVRHPFPEAPLL